GPPSAGATLERSADWSGGRKRGLRRGRAARRDDFTSPRRRFSARESRAPEADASMPHPFHYSRERLVGVRRPKSVVLLRALGNVGGDGEPFRVLRIDT